MGLVSTECARLASSESEVVCARCGVASNISALDGPSHGDAPPPRRRVPAASAASARSGPCASSAMTSARRCGQRTRRRGRRGRERRRWRREGGWRRGRRASRLRPRCSDRCAPPAAGKCEISGPARPQHHTISLSLARSLAAHHDPSRSLSLSLSLPSLFHVGPT